MLFHNFKFLVLVFTIVQLAQCYENYTLSNQAYRICFPLYADQQGVQLDISLLEYNPLPGLSLEENATNVAVIVYRHKELNHDKVFVGDYNIHTVCDDDAMRRGYCEPKHKGKILFEYKEDGDYQGNAFSEIFHEVGTFADVHEFKESGYYCARAVAFKAKDFKVQLLVKDGHSLRKYQRDDIRIELYRAIGYLVFGSFFYFKWLKWSNSNNTYLPYLVKVFSADIFIQFIILLISMAVSYLDANAQSTWTFKTLNCLGMLFVSFQNVALVFYLYQYSGNFTYDKFDFQYIKIFGATYFAVTLPYFAKKYIDKLVNGSNSDDVDDGQEFVQLLTILLAIFGLILGLFHVIVKVRTIIRYFKSSKEYRDSNQNDNPKLKQFKWTIWTKITMGLVFDIFFGFIMEILDLILKLVPFYKNNFLIDGKVTPYEYVEELVKNTILLSVQFYVLFKFWTPQYLKKAQDYKPIE